MAQTIEAARARAEALFKPAERDRPGPSAGLSRQDAAALAVQEKTARLRALRLEKEAADRTPAPPKPGD